MSTPDLRNKLQRVSIPLDARRIDLLTDLAKDDTFDESKLVASIEKLKGDPELLEVALPKWLDWLRGPTISDFQPRKGRAGDVLTITGSRFDADRLDNTVTVGGASATVLEATPTMLKVLTDPATVDGPLTVQIGAKTVTGPEDFSILPYPADGEDGPPIIFAGAGEAQSGDVSPTGTGRILVVLVNPSDRVPSNATTSRSAVVSTWGNVRTYYEQASYFAAPSTGKSWNITTTANFATLSGTTSDYCDFSASVNNIKQGSLDRLMAEAAQSAVNAGHNLNDFQIMAVVLYLNGSFIRAWGGWETQSFSYDPGSGGTKIAITLNQPINLLAVQETANWGRLAHEVGHNVVAVPGGVSDIKTKGGTAVFGEDVYASDLVDGSTATAQAFELMGDHDSHPLFSGYFLDKLGWYRPDNASHDGDIRTLEWNRNAFSQEFDLVAHGLARNTVAGRHHLLKITVANGLCYYVQVRQRPGGVTASQVFDTNIPGTSGPTDGGVIVTRVLTDTNAENQQSRIITLLHDQTVLHTGQSAIDPARDLTITVVKDDVVVRPQVCRVRVAWAQGIADDPNGAFDLSITPWDESCTTPDIWVDRVPAQGMFDKPLDAQGRPEGNGDKPKPGALNKIVARVSNSGTVAVSDVKVTFYAVYPPGVGDNGAWSPLITRTIGSIAQNGTFDITADWFPVVGKHTCLKVFVSPQLGEITGGDNSAQENVFDFDAPAFSPPQPLVLPIAVRNPRDEDVVAQMSLTRVPRGYTVQFPHQWVVLKPHEERQFEMVVIPTLDVAAYVYARETLPTAPIRLVGYLGRQYSEQLTAGEEPGSRFSFMGGVLSNVTPKRGTSIEFWEDRERDDKRFARLRGYVARSDRRDRVTVTVTDVDSGAHTAVEVSTDDSSAFVAEVDLGEIAMLAGRDADDVGGTYEAFAETFAAQTVAEAVSPTIVVVR